jgi:hypothetical protein
MRRFLRCLVKGHRYHRLGSAQVVGESLHECLRCGKWKVLA